MAEAEILQESKIREDLDHALHIYVIDELDSIDDILEGVKVINELGKGYRHLHVELKDKLAHDYIEKFPHYANVVDKYTKYLKEAQKKVKLLRQDLNKNVDLERNELLKVDKEVLELKIKQYVKTFDISLAQDINELDNYVDRMEGFIEEYANLSGKFKICFRDRYETLYAEEFLQKIAEMSEDIKMSKLLKKKLCEVIDSDKKGENTKLVKSENLSEEIKLRFESLETKYDQNMNVLSDYQILEINQNKNLDVEFNNILEKITDLSELVSIGGDMVRAKLDRATSKRDVVVRKKKLFHSKLQEIILERDITPDKLKNASTLQIDLPKFSGYDSKMDFFTFKTEFKKLVEPIVQKKYWADYLKRNYLSGSALILVEKENNYEKIWERLLESFGNARLLLQNKLGEVDKIGSLWKLRGDEKIANALAGLINAMKDLSSLARQHRIEGQLHEGGGLEKVMSLLGDGRHRKFRSKNLNSSSTKKEEWENLIEFLKQELQLRERLTLDNKSAQLMGFGLKNEKYNDGNSRSNKVGGKSPTYTSVTHNLKCHFCDKEDHTVVITPKGNKIIPYYVCELFVGMTPAQRLSKMKSKNLCTKCLFPGAYKGPKHKCFFTNYCCPHSHDGEKIHVLLCNLHKSDAQNLKILEDFKDRFIKNCSVQLPQYSKQISCFSNMVAVSELGGKPECPTFSNLQSEPDVIESAIFMLQTIEVDGVKLNIFFDSGCGGMVIKKGAIDKLVGVGRAKQVVSGPMEIIGVGNSKSVSDDGVYSICLPLHDGTNVELSGLCMPKITTEFPMYDLSKVEKDLKKKCESVCGQDFANQLPKLPRKVGGDTDILLGIQYAKYCPKPVFQCESGLGIYESVFKSPCGARAVLGGPHREFSLMEKRFRGQFFRKAYTCSSVTPLDESIQQFRRFWKVNNEVPLLGTKIDASMLSRDLSCCSKIDDISLCEPQCGSESYEMEIGEEARLFDSKLGATSGNLLDTLGAPKQQNDVLVAKRPPKCIKQFDEIDKSGTEVSYRCVDCRGCLKCKTSARIDSISIQEEIEQGVIEKSVRLDVDQGRSIAKLPFLVADPDSRIGPNEKDALRVYRSQAKMLSTRPTDKAAVIEAEQKLQQLGFVDYVENLSEDEKALIYDNVRYFLPWRTVYNENSPSTPCRPVFDASQGSKGGGCSLNSLLAKGVNSMNKLIEILIRWSTHAHAYHTDLSKMYNRVLMEKEYWRYQLYLWHNELGIDVEPFWKVIKTLIYGVRPSGNLAACAVRRTAEHSKEVRPEAYKAITKDVFVDDFASGTENAKKTDDVTEQVKETLYIGGFLVKGFVKSLEDPPPHLSNGEDFVTVFGLKWFPKGDFIKLNIGELNFNRKVRGKKSTEHLGIIPEFLSKRDCVRKICEIFDPTGKTAPILVGFKLDISTLHVLCFGWDEEIPNELKNVWSENFDVIKELGNIEFKRAVVPEDAISLDIETIETADAGENIICAAIYARFKRKHGKHSCQLIFSRTKIVHESIPRNEIEACLLNASTGHVVHVSLGDKHVKCWKLSDSQVALHWINSTRTALKMYVRNRVLEILRLTEPKDWYHVSSKDMIADLGTRKGAKISDIGPDSAWIQGYPWMRGQEKNFPIKTINEIVLSNKSKSDANREKIIPEIAENVCLVNKYVPKEVGIRYKFSKYLVDPNKFRFRKVIRIVAFVFLFIQKISVKYRARGKILSFLEQRTLNSEKTHIVICPMKNTPISTYAVVQLSEDLINAATAYYFKKTTLEVKHFVDVKKYENNSILKNGILYHTGRILPVQEIDGRISLADACLDLASGSFCVPVIDANSPVAYAIVAEVHWHSPDVSHGGVEAVLRYAQQIAYIIGGRALVKTIKKECAKCRILSKKGLQIAMGPIGDNNLHVAPPFYICQVDICGPFNAYSPVNKRATLKVWFTVFCCTVTGAIDCRIMENYSADAFIMAFIRFSCRFGYPKKVLPDEGSQLVKGCQDMILSMSDIQNKLSVEYGVEFKTCPTGAHYVHGKVERKIQDIKRSLQKTLNKNRLSVLQWETLGQQIANSINNGPIGLGNKTEMIEYLDILSPNRLILGRNNTRSPTAPLEIRHDARRIIESNNVIFQAWFKEWLISYVPTLIERPKWFVTERNITKGDVVLFLKSDKEFDRQYQYGIVTLTTIGRDGVVRVVEVEYQNPNESVKRKTTRGVRDLVVIHPIDEIGISKELHEFANYY